MFDIDMWSMRIEIPKACQVVICLSLDFNKFFYDSDYFYSFVDYDFRVTFFVSFQFSTLTSQGPIQAAFLFVHSKYKEMYQYGNIKVNLYQVMSMLKLKTDVNLPQLLCIVVSAAQNGEFE